VPDRDLNKKGFMRIAKSEIPTLFPWCWSHWLPLVVAAVLFTLSPRAAKAELPQVLLVENHGDVLVPWVRTGVRGAVVVNVDAHDDCLPITPDQASKLRRFFAVGDVAAIGRANSGADSGLYGIGTYIAAAYALGIASEAVWVAPLLPAPGRLAWTNFPVRTCPLESLPELRGPVLLTVDADVVPSFAAYRCIDPVEAVRRIGKTLRAVPWEVKHASVCFSVDGGYLPVQLRWVGNALQEALDGKDLSRPKAPWPLLATVEDWRRGLLPREVVRRVRPLVLQRPTDPWLHVYLSDALFRADDVAGALAEGKKAARLDSGCCRILPEIGRQLANAGRLDEAERFLAAAPAMVNIPAELDLAQALDRAGRTAQAIGHYSRICGKVANYSAELLIGYAYERLGDRSRARQHYLHAVALFVSPVDEMPAFASFADIAPAGAAAERLLRASGDQLQAQVLRQDPKLAPLFNKDKDGAPGH
jgi:Flp pilus assembly protein TadD